MYRHGLIVYSSLLPRGISQFHSKSTLDYKTSHKVWPPRLPTIDLPRSRCA
ncbi:hypothetical protein EI94DRAFT_1742285 [Lactarius quietus]|nr:hypothetical protein EI94DRAFT_1742285 [Lactarius quietus]